MYDDDHGLPVTLAVRGEQYVCIYIYIYMYRYI